MTTKTVNEDFEKQNETLLQMAIIGPVMLYSATGKEMPGILKAGLFLYGLATIGRNVKRYYDLEEKKKQEIKANALNRSALSPYSYR